ncbi:MAG: TldD/PmbA family protein [Vulcanimicrobiaceae bacterium]
MDKSEALSAAQRAVAIALDAGASDAEATLSVARQFHAEVRDTTIAKLEQSTSKGLHVRLFVNGRRAGLSTSDFSDGALRSALAATVDQAGQVAEDPFSGLPEEFASDRPELDLEDPVLASRDDAAKVDDALELERLIRAADPRIENSSGSDSGDTATTVAIANSRGFGGAYAGTRAGLSTGPVGDDGGAKRTAHYGTAGRKLADLESVQTVASIAAKRVVEMFGARKPQTMRVPVIFERDVAAAVLADIFAALSAAHVAVGNSWLAGRIGERIGSELVNLVDDGRLPGKLGSSPFDGEGVATRRTAAFERGILRTFLYDTYYGRKLGAASTGNASGGSIGPNTFYLEPGSGTLDDLVAKTARGVLVLETIGFATEHASGTYSRGARGFYIENGELAYPVEEFTIAGRFPDMLAAVDAVAADLRFDGSVVAPSFRVGEMMLSGE